MIPKYNILGSLYSIILCKVPAHIGFKGNEKADRAAKQAIDMPEMTTTRINHTYYYLTIRRARQREWENNTSKLHYIKPRIEE